MSEREERRGEEKRGDQPRDDRRAGENPGRADRRSAESGGEQRRAAQGDEGRLKALRMIARKRLPQPPAVRSAAIHASLWGDSGAVVTSRFQNIACRKYGPAALAPALVSASPGASAPHAARSHTAATRAPTIADNRHDACMRACTSKLPAKARASCGLLAAAKIEVHAALREVFRIEIEPTPEVMSALARLPRPPAAEGRDEG